MTETQFSPVLFEGPAYALVIGIDRYKYGQPPDDEKPLGEKNFRNLKVAAKDAKDFGQFLTQHGFLPNTVTVLPDEEATATNIKKAFRRLRDACLAEGTKDPVVIVFFSGHGMPEDEETHYLVPHDGEADELAATAISNVEFNNLLQGLKTRRLVVFLDACHSGGMFGRETKGAREGAPLQYEARGLGGGEGRIVIASCRKGEQSYESGENGIFTGKLLALLSGRSPHFDETPEIDVFDLYSKLRTEVLQAAQEVHHKRQEPQINEAKETTGIVLAVNPAVRQRKNAEDQRKKAQEQRRDFVDALVARLMQMPDLQQKTTICTRLQGYAWENTRIGGHDALYSIFDENLPLWKPDSEVFVQQCCETLVIAYRTIMASPLSKPKEGERKSPSTAQKDSARTADAIEGLPKSALVGREDSQPFAPPPMPAEPQSPRRKLSEDERNYILGEMAKNLSFWRERRDLDGILAQPTTNEEFSAEIGRISSRKSGAVWDGILDETVNRFQERFPQAEVSDVKSGTLLGIRTGKIQ